MKKIILFIFVVSFNIYSVQPKDLQKMFRLVSMLNKRIHKFDSIEVELTKLSEKIETLTAKYNYYSEDKKRLEEEISKISKKLEAELKNLLE